MLLEFKTKNYKSFVDEMVFSMIPASKQRKLDYSILSMRIDNKTYRGLSAAVIYGPNASGKTNMIGAMDTFKEIVKRGNIKNTPPLESPNVAANILELIPNCKKKSGPTEFSVRFVDDDLLVEYSIKVDFGSFLNKNYKRRILEEKLGVNGTLVFLRKKSLVVNLPGSIKGYVNQNSLSKSLDVTVIAEGSLADTDLFLNNGFKAIYAQKLVERILDWFDNKFIVIYRSNDLRLVRKFANPEENTIYVQKTLTEAAKEFGITGNALVYRTQGGKGGDDVKLYSMLKNAFVRAEAFESYGTIRFINEFPLVIYALIHGGTLVMDEFDASIHPMALMNIINIFHNDELNKHHAQLIFNTHNPIFLDSSLLRKDEIKFVERNENGNSEHYSLSDFRTVDNRRKAKDYMHNYFVSKYGAIKEIDFSPLIEKIISKSEATENE